MASSTTARKGGTDHKGAADQQATADRKAPGTQEAVPGQRTQGQRAKAEPDRETSSGLHLGLKLPNGAKGNMLWWGSLAALAALEIVDWPVAAVVAAGSWVAERHMKQQKQAKRAETMS
jgi:hypothetical protein